jgi:negative regulator of flagellin synthesis FlgM
MKIGNETNSAAISLYRNESTEQRPESTSADAGKSRSGGSDRVEISFNRQEVDRLSKAASQLPDIRSDKVAELKGRIDAGDYQVPGRMVAEKMLGR